MMRGYHDEETRAGLPSWKTTQRTAISNDMPQPPSLFSCSFCATTKPNYKERLPRGRHSLNVNMRQKMNLPLYFLQSTQMARICKPLVSPLHKQQLRLTKCGYRLYHLQNLAKSSLTSLPAGKIMPKQQHGHTTA